MSMLKRFDNYFIGEDTEIRPYFYGFFGAALVSLAILFLG